MKKFKDRISKYPGRRKMIILDSNGKATEERIVDIVRDDSIEVVEKDALGIAQTGTQVNASMLNAIIETAEEAKAIAEKAMNTDNFQGYYCIPYNYSNNFRFAPIIFDYKTPFSFKYKVISPRFDPKSIPVVVVFGVNIKDNKIEFSKLSMKLLSDEPVKDIEICYADEKLLLIAGTDEACIAGDYSLLPNYNPGFQSFAIAPGWIKSNCELNQYGDNVFWQTTGGDILHKNKINAYGGLIGTI